MDTNDSIPILGAPKTLNVLLEVPATFTTTLFFINHQGEYTTTQFALPPGVYPNPKWMPRMIEGAYRESLKALKIATKDLSWRKCSTAEFVRATAGNQAVKADPKWQEPYSVELQLGDIPKVIGEDEDGGE